MFLSEDSQDSWKIDAAISQFVEDALPFIGIPVTLRYWPFVAAAIFRLTVFQMELNNPVRISRRELNRVNAGHIDVACVKHQVNMIWIRQIHQLVDLFAIL